MFHDITEKRIGDNSSLIFVSNSIAFQLFRNQTKFTRFNMLRLESLTIRYREIYHRPMYTYTETNRKVRCSNHERHTRETLFLPKNDCIEVERCCEYTTWTYQGPLSDRGRVITSRKKGNARGIKKKSEEKKRRNWFQDSDAVSFRQEILGGIGPAQGGSRRMNSQPDKIAGIKVSLSLQSIAICNDAAALFDVVENRVASFRKRAVSVERTGTFHCWESRRLRIRASNTRN